MTAVILVGDVHLNSRAPSGRTATYTEDILAKLQFCVDEANRRSVPLVQAGDLFHTKNWRNNPYNLVTRTHEVLRKVDKGTWIVPGNHDLQHDRLESLESQPLGALCRMENVNLLMGYDERLPDVYGVPYLTEFDGGDWKTAVEPYLDDVEGGEFSIGPYLLVTHAPMFPIGQEPGVYAHVDIDEWSELFLNMRACYYGHIHDYHGTHWDSTEEYQFCNQGALSRGSLHESSVKRKPAITYWDGSTFERIEVPHKPAEEVFKFVQQAEAKQKQQISDEFSKALGSVTLEAVTVEQVLAHVRASGVGHDVVTLVETLVEDALHSQA